MMFSSANFVSCGSCILGVKYDCYDVEVNKSCFSLLVVLPNSKYLFFTIQEEKKEGSRRT